ncbi:hypothetical protein GCM10010365_75640 [Streptomyces poonensis]|uniref:Uncharacterized protein n=1 Tax=Streptomyces poonensis TaxID=68255 RepID=A0A918UYC2_9ACTN|nr:hypothetical protein GCM10010365_75640 [Streptomyces poonensis]
MESGDGHGSSGQHPPKLRLGELLDELQARIDAARGTQDRVRSLLEAGLSVGGELNLSRVLRCIVEAVVVLVDAEYGALDVIGEDRRLSQFLTVGVDEEQRARIGDLPSGHGNLGELIRHPEPWRLPELVEHQAPYGLPDARETSGVRGQVAEVARASATSFGSTPALRVEGLVDTEVPDEVPDHVTAVLGEALSEAARHS